MVAASILDLVLRVGRLRTCPYIRTSTITNHHILIKNLALVTRLIYNDAAYDGRGPALENLARERFSVLV